MIFSETIYFEYDVKYAIKYDNVSIYMPFTLFQQLKSRF